MRKVCRALLSVTDKAGIVELAQALASHGCELISTGGTRRVLEDAGIAVTEISAVTGNPEAFGGRMKTISFAVESAILFDRDRDADEAARLGIEPIDMVVCNLYPFTAVRDRGGALDELIENVDIGGPTMIRAAAKNYVAVAVVTEPGDYPALIEEMAAHNGALGQDTRARLMRQAFNLTADYDAAIAQAMDERFGAPSLRLAFERGEVLRYGENAHQSAMVLRQRGAERSLCDMEVLGGKALSFNNLADIQAAWDAVRDLAQPACSIIKHQNPCGLAEGSGLADVFVAAWDGDPTSAFGSVIAFNRPLDVATARFLELDGEKAKRKFVEVVSAPAFDDDTLSYLRLHTSLRIVQFAPSDAARGTDMRFLAGALLVQEADRALWAQLEVVTEAAPTALDERLIAFGVVAARQVKSNAIVVVRRRADGVHQLLGIGAGQPNRINSTQLALDKARANLSREGDEGYVREQLGGAYLISDAFFPFADNVELCAEAGIRTMIQPGGSMRDKSVIRRCNALGVAMVFTGTRHFLH